MVQKYFLTLILQDKNIFNQLMLTAIRPDIDTFQRSTYLVVANSSWTVKITLVQKYLLYGTTIKPDHDNGHTQTCHKSNVSLETSRPNLIY